MCVHMYMWYIKLNTDTKYLRGAINYGLNFNRTHSQILLKVVSRTIWHNEKWITVTCTILTSQPMIGPRSQTELSKEERGNKRDLMVYCRSQRVRLGVSVSLMIQSNHSPGTGDGQSCFGVHQDKTPWHSSPLFLVLFPPYLQSTQSRSHWLLFWER